MHRANPNQHHRKPIPAAKLCLKDASNASRCGEARRVPAHLRVHAPDVEQLIDHARQVVHDGTTVIGPNGTSCSQFASPAL